MSRRLIAIGFGLLAFGGATAYAEVWPAAFAGHKLLSETAAPPAAADQALWEEYGLVSAMEGSYGPFRATAYRFKDWTGAFAALQWIHSTDRSAVRVANLVVTCRGTCPERSQFEQFPVSGPRGENQTPIWAYLPSKRMNAGSARYALGRLGLQKFVPEIPPEAAAFQFSTEVITARYSLGSGQETLVLLSFPSPDIARRQAAQLQKLSGAVVKRTGPIVAVVPDPPQPAAALELLDQINYRASLTVDERPEVKVTAQGVARMILTILALAGILILFCVAAGLGYAGIRMLRYRLGPESAREPMIVLHLLDR